MKKKTMMVIGFIVIIIIVCIFCFFFLFKEESNPKEGDIKLISVESIGGTYNANIYHQQIYLSGGWQDFLELNYTKDGKEHQGSYIPSMKDTLEWIKINTSENSTILCWWDYGIMLEGYAERNVIARHASLALKDTIAMFGSLDEDGKKKFIEEHEWTSNETIEELAKILITTNISSDETMALIQKYNVSYIFSNSYDELITWIFLDAARKNLDEYYTDKVPNEKCNETLIFKLWNDVPEISGLELIYEQNIDYERSVRIFKII